jgi:hypothetical protein
VSSAPEEEVHAVIRQMRRGVDGTFSSKRRVALTSAATSVAPSPVRHSSWKALQLHTVAAVKRLPCAQKYGPPAMAPAPFTMLEWATSNWTAM